MNYQKISRIIRRGPYSFFCYGWARIKSNISYYKTHEQRKSYGKDMPDKTFYVCGFNEGWCGLFAILAHQLMHIAYAVERGYIPVVDLQNYDNQYLSIEKRFKENAWEYFFQQPMDYDLNSIKKAKNVIKSIQYGDPPDKKYSLEYTSCWDQDAITYWKAIFEKYIKFSAKSEEFLTNSYNELLKNKGRVLGVLCRGTDFVSLRPAGHPIQPDPKIVIKKAEETLNKYRCDHLYLSTEDADIYDLFIEHFKDKLILDHIDKWRVSDLQGGCNAIDTMADSLEKQKRGISYLSQIYLLSQCTCFIGGATYGSVGALLMPNKFEYQFIYNLGVY